MGGGGSNPCPIKYFSVFSLFKTWYSTAWITAWSSETSITFILGWLLIIKFINHIPSSFQLDNWPNFETFYCSADSHKLEIHLKYIDAPMFSQRKLFVFHCTNFIVLNTSNTSKPFYFRMYLQFKKFELKLLFLWLRYIMGYGGK